jgi:glycosyltransferase involved in cell wall biosynthesis
LQVTFFIPNLRPGGAERVAVQLLHFFYESGISVNLLLYKKEGKLLEQLNPAIKVYALECKGTKEAVIPLIKFCKLQRPDILFASLGAAVAVSIAKPFLPNKTKLITRVGSTFGAERQTIKSPFKRAIYSGLTKHVARQTDTLIFQSQFMENDFLENIPVDKSKRHVIYNPVSISEISLKANDEATATDLVAIGSLLPAKDFSTLIQSIHFYKTSNQQPISLSIIGGGPLENDLKVLVNELQLTNEVKFLGYQKNPYKFLSKAKYLISSSIYEGFSNVILESLALGIPVIATDCPSGNREIVKEGENGFFTKVGNPKHMAEVIDKALKGESQFDSIFIASSIRKRFNIDHIGKQYLNLIEG